MDAELQEAKYRVDNNLVDLDHVAPATFGEGGFKEPKELLHWLEENRPDFDPDMLLMRLRSCRIGRN